MKPYYQEDGITIYHGDSREVLPYLEFDIMVTDPPYGTGGWRRSESGGGSDPSAILILESWDSLDVSWLCPVPTLAFWSAANAAALLTQAINIGLTKHRTLYMQKLDPKPQVAGRIAWSVEPIWCLSRDGFVLKGGSDWYSASTPREGRDREATGHPYQKPLEVMHWLIAKTADAIICDPFCGSGTTLRAAKDLGRQAIGIELDERYCEIAAQRLSQRVLPLELIGAEGEKS